MWKNEVLNPFVKTKKKLQEMATERGNFVTKNYFYFILTKGITT